MAVRGRAVEIEKQLFLLSSCAFSVLGAWRPDLQVFYMYTQTQGQLVRVVLINLRILVQKTLRTCIYAHAVYARWTRGGGG
jgi:hypothetical protein